MSITPLSRLLAWDVEKDCPLRPGEITLVDQATMKPLGVLRWSTAPAPAPGHVLTQEERLQIWEDSWGAGRHRFSGAEERNRQNAVAVPSSLIRWEP